MTPIAYDQIKVTQADIDMWLWCKAAIRESAHWREDDIKTNEHLFLLDTQGEKLMAVHRTGLSQYPACQTRGPGWFERLIKASEDREHAATLVMLDDLRLALAHVEKLRTAIREAIEEARTLECNTDPLVDRILTPALKTK